MTGLESLQRQVELLGRDRRVKDRTISQMQKRIEVLSEEVKALREINAERIQEEIEADAERRDPWDN